MKLRLLCGDAETVSGLQKARHGNLNLPRDRYVDLTVVAPGAFVVIDRNGKDMPWYGYVDENGWRYYIWHTTDDKPIIGGES